LEIQAIVDKMNNMPPELSLRRTV